MQIPKGFTLILLYYSKIMLAAFGWRAFYFRVVTFKLCLSLKRVICNERSLLMRYLLYFIIAFGVTTLWFLIRYIANLPKETNSRL